MPCGAPDFSVVSIPWGRHGCLGGVVHHDSSLFSLGLRMLEPCFPPCCRFLLWRLLVCVLLGPEAWVRGAPLAIAFWEVAWWNGKILVPGGQDAWVPLLTLSPAPV